MSKKIEKKKTSPSPPILDQCLDSSQQDSFKTALDFAKESFYQKQSPYQQQEEEKQEFILFQESPIVKKGTCPQKQICLQSRPFSYGDQLEDGDEEKEDITDTVQRRNEESEDPKVLSTVIPYSKYSFVRGAQQIKKYDPKTPPPLYLTYQQLKKTRDVDLKDIMSGIIVPDKGGFQCIDKHVISKQKGLMGEVTKQFVKCVMTRQPISGISLPTRVFEPRSQIQRILDTFGLIPLYFKKAAQTSDSLQRLKLVITCVISGLYSSAKQLKPFNPILGETYQGHFQDGTQIYCQHTSHHPPISNFLLEGPFIDDLSISTSNSQINLNEQEKYKLQNVRAWVLSGFYQFTGDKSSDTFKVGQKGPNRLRFHDGHQIEWVNPVFKLNISGKRFMNYTGDITFWDKTHNRKATVIVDHTRKVNFLGKTKRTGKVDDFEGVIYQINMDRFTKLKFNTQKIYQWKHPTKIDQIQDIGIEISKISGSWLRQVCFTDYSGDIKKKTNKYWQLGKNDYIPWIQRAEKKVLPSDWRYRQDLLWLKYKNELYADNWKLQLERVQRQDRAWRTNKKKKWKK